MRKVLKPFLPDHQTLRQNRWLAPFAATLLHPRLWHLNRHSAAGGVALGLFCGLIPGPFQMLAAAILATLWRVNLPLALITTLYTNPLTIVPIYLMAYQLGRLVLGHQDARFSPPPEMGDPGLIQWLTDLGHWMLSLGKPLGLGLLLLGLLLALAGYVIVRTGWRLYLLRAWHQRKKQRKPPSTPCP